MEEPVIVTTEQLTNTLSRVSLVNTVLDFKWKFEFKPCVVQFSSKEIRLGKHPVEITEERRGWLVWVSFERPDTITGNVGRGRGRDEIVWSGTTLSGVVKTGYVLVELMVRHELMEGFRFDNSRIFNPHNSVLDLAKVQELHDERVRAK